LLQIVITSRATGFTLRRALSELKVRGSRQLREPDSAPPFRLSAEPLFHHGFSRYTPMLYCRSEAIGA
jgi:hypothetical protein